MSSARRHLDRLRPQHLRRDPASARLGLGRRALRRFGAATVAVAVAAALLAVPLPGTAPLGPDPAAAQSVPPAAPSGCGAPTSGAAEVLIVTTTYRSVTVNQGPGTNSTDRGAPEICRATAAVNGGEVFNPRGGNFIALNELPWTFSKWGTGLEDPLLESGTDYWVRWKGYTETSPWQYAGTKGSGAPAGCGTDGDNHAFNTVFASVTPSATSVAFTISTSAPNTNFPLGSPLGQMVLVMCSMGEGGAYSVSTVKAAGTFTQWETMRMNGDTVTVSDLTAETDYWFQMQGYSRETEWFPVRTAPTPTAAPQFALGDSTSFEVAENNADGASVGTLTVVQSDSDPVTYSLTGTDASTFDIGASSGEITVASGVTLDYETKSTYSVTAQVTDGKDASDTVEGTPTIDDTITVTISVTDTPDPPTAPTVTAVTPVSLRVSWSAPEGATSVEDYDVRYYQGTADPSAEADWVEEGETNAWPDPGTKTSLNITGLTANTTYRVQVRASIDSTGTETPWSASGTGTTQMALAGSEVLVSNIGQAESGTVHSNLGTTIGSGFGQQFTTGANTEGYTLGTVEVDFADVATGVRVRLFSSDGAVVLANPATLVTGNNTFTAPAGTSLKANTNYEVLINGVSGNLSVKTATAEDSGGKSDWSVADNRYIFGSDDVLLGTPTTGTEGPLGIRVNGVVPDTTPPTLESATIENLLGGVTFKSALALVFNEDLDRDHAVGADSFTAEADDEALTVFSVSSPSKLNPRRYLLLITELVSPDAEVTVSYERRTGIQAIQDTRLNEAANFTDVAVTNNMSPGVSGVAFVSDPGSGGAYGVGGHIDVSLTFNTNVTVDTASGTPSLKIKFASGASGVEKAAGYHSGSGSKVLVFRYTVAAGDASEGVAVVANSLALNSGTIKSMSSDVDAVLDHSGVAHDAGHRIETVAPTLTAAVVTADGRRLALVYDEDLDAGSVPVSAQFSFEQVQTGGNTPIGGAVFAYSIVGNRVEMTKVSGSLDTSATFKVTYDYSSSIASHRPIRDLAGNNVDSILAQTLIQLTDPAFSAETASFDVVENHAAAIAVGTVTAADADSDTVAYSLAAGADASSFAVNSSTGAITVASGVTLNHEAQATYSLVVQAADGEDEFGQPDTPAASVSKTGQAHSTDYEFGQLSAGNVRQAQSFTTGSRAWGYTLSEIGVHMYEWDGNLATVTAGVWSTTATGAPDSLLYTLTNPATAVDGAVNTFTAPAGAVLEPATTYALVLANSSTSGVGVSATGSFDLDSGASAGWDISDTRLQSAGEFWTFRGHSFRISVAAKGRSQPDDTIAVTVNVTDVDEPLTAKPTGLTVTGQATTSITLSWTAPDSGTGPAVTDYDVRWFAGSADPSDAADWVEAGEADGHDHVGAATTTTVVGLTKTTAYRFQVRADNGESGTAKGPWSDSVGASTIDQPGIVLIATPTMVNEGSTATVTIRAERDTTENSAAVTVQLELLDTSTATSGTDYTALGMLPTITIGEDAESASTTLDIAATQDPIDEGAGTTGDPYEFIHLGGKATGFDVNSTRIAIVDDDDASTEIELSLEAGGASVTEVGEGVANALSLTVKATLDEGARKDNDVVVTVTLGGDADKGAATDASRDYTDPGTVSITIPKGKTSASTSATVSIDPHDDTLAEGDETIIFTPSTSASGFTTLTAATLTIKDNDSKPTKINLSFEPSSIVENHGAAVTVSVKATLDGDSTRTVPTVVALGSLGGSATEGATDDYTKSGTVPTTVTIPVGMSSVTSASFTITPIDDTVSDGDKTITMTGSACQSTPDPGEDCPDIDVFVVEPAALVLNDNELPVITLSIARTGGDNTSISEGSDGATFTVTAKLDETTTEMVTVPLAVSGTATSGTDYAISPTTLPSISIAAGDPSSTANVTITPSDDELDEADETIVLGATVGGFNVTAATITIIDDDPRPVFESATVDGTELVITFSVDLDDSSVPAPTDFFVSVAGARRLVAADGVDIDDKTVTLTLASAVTAGQTVTVRYTKPSSNPLQNPEVIRTGFCAGSKDWSEHGIYGHRSGAGGDVSPVFG